ncbi:hypothetical protein A9Q99_17420 [Gammaproteobacteria bacterium 45_16_T64]|nr:hypothetical protein A9Q99_17420 [Gammaproteobacteria bacterium 45_16_T64]
MTTVTELLSDITVKLDDRSRQAVADILGMVEGAGKVPLFLSISHLFSWAEKGISGPLNVATEDWEGFASAMSGMAVLRLNAIERIATFQARRFALNDGGGQQEFWDNVSRAAYKAKMRVGR